MRRITDWEKCETRLVDDAGNVIERHTFAQLHEAEQAALKQPPPEFTGPTTEDTPPDVAWRYLMSRSWAKKGEDIDSQTALGLRRLAKYREGSA